MVTDRELTAAEVAERAGCRPDYVRKLRTRGTLPGRKIGQQWFYAEADVEAWLASPRQRGPRPGSRRKPLFRPAGPWVGVTTTANRARAFHIATSAPDRGGRVSTLCGWSGRAANLITSTTLAALEDWWHLPLCKRCRAEADPG